MTAITILMAGLWIGYCVGEGLWRIAKAIRETKR
jgi:hypothetical protein